MREELWLDPASPAMTMAAAIDVRGDADRIADRGVGYPGGKSGSGVWQRIISQMPPHRVYVEPFLGHGAVIRHKRPASGGWDIGIDLSMPVIRWWRELAGCEKIAKGVKGERRRSSSPIVARGDGIRFLRRQLEVGAVDSSWLAYADPPYLRETRTRLFYDHELPTAAEHSELLALLNGLADRGCRVMLSGYMSPLYFRSLPASRWREISYQTMTRGGLRTEYLWCSFPEPVELHDCSVIGGTFRERERIKRKRQRWTSRFMAMAPGERQVIREALSAAEAGS